MAINKKNWFGVAVKRLKSETPSFFKKAFGFFKWLSGTGLAMYGVPELMNKGLLSEELILNLQTISTYVMLAGAIGMILTKLPTNDPDLQ